jgi:hypothetical protein
MPFLDYRLHPLSSYLWLCYLVLLWCTSSSKCEHDLRRAFNIMLLVLKGNFGFKLSSHLLFLWLPRRHSLLDVVAFWLHFLENSRQMCHDHLQHFDFFRDVNCVHDEKYLSCPRWNFVIIDNPFDFISSRACPCYGCNLLSSLKYVLPCSITVFYVKNVVRIVPPLSNSWYSGTSRHHRSFFVPVLILTGVPATSDAAWILYF